MFVQELLRARILILVGALLCVHELLKPSIIRLVKLLILVQELLNSRNPIWD